MEECVILLDILNPITHEDNKCVYETFLALFKFSWSTGIFSVFHMLQGLSDSHHTDIWTDVYENFNWHFCNANFSIGSQF